MPVNSAPYDRDVQKLIDLTSRAQRIGAMTWDEFKERHPVDPPRNWTNGSALLGGMLGAIGGGLAGAALIGSGVSPIVAMGGVGAVGAAAGAVIGRQFPMQTDTRRAQIDAYEQYLNDAQSQGRARAQSAVRNPQTTLVEAPETPRRVEEQQQTIRQ